MEANYGNLPSFHKTKSNKLTLVIRYSIRGPYDNHNSDSRSILEIIVLRTFIHSANLMTISFTNYSLNRIPFPLVDMIY